MLVGAFNQEKALQVAFSGIVQLSQLIVCSTSLQSSSCWHGLGSPWVSTKFMAQNPKSCPVTDVTYFLSWFKRVPLEQKEALVKISIIHIKVQSKQAIDKTARLPVHPEWTHVIWESTKNISLLYCRQRVCHSSLNVITVIL